MSLFCFLWVPLFYLLWRTVKDASTSAGGVWALLFGSITAAVRFITGPFVDPGEFGFSRWISAGIDFVALPALAPMIVYLLMVALKIIGGNLNFANFALLWLIPGAAVRAVVWSVQNDPIHLMVVPVLWTAIAVGVPFFIDFFKHQYRLLIIPAVLGIIAVPLAATSSYWAFYAHNTGLGFILLLAAATPMLVSVIWSFIFAEGS